MALSAVIFNALVIVALIPLALKGVAYRPIGAAAMLRRNLFRHGLGGILVPFAGINPIDLLITALNLVRSCANEFPAANPTASNARQREIS